MLMGANLLNPLLMLDRKSEGSKPRPLWAKQSLYLKVAKNPTPCGWLDFEVIRPLA
jgi:hypothetical protein